MFASQQWVGGGGGNMGRGDKKKDSHVRFEEYCPLSTRLHAIGTILRAKRAQFHRDQSDCCGRLSQVEQDLEQVRIKRGNWKKLRETVCTIANIAHR